MTPDHDAGMVDRPELMLPLWFRDQDEGESPGAMYGMARRFNRIFSWDGITRYPHLEDERLAFDPGLLSPRARYLLNHVFRLQIGADEARWRTMLHCYPLLRGLGDIEPIDEPIVCTTKPPPYAWSYLTGKGIYL